MLAEAGAAGNELARDARAWIVSIAEADGGIPFVLTGFEDHPHAPWWSPQPGSFLTFESVAAFHAAGVTDDEWLDSATDWSWRSIETAEQPDGYWLKNACRFLDAVPDEVRARTAIASLATRLDPSTLGSGEGTEGLRALDLSPRPGSRSRDLIGDAQVEAHLDAVESGQQEDGGWMFDFLAWSPAQTTEWRGVVTIGALICLRENGRL